jgi:hypothetical protein
MILILREGRRVGELLRKEAIESLTDHFVAYAFLLKSGRVELGVCALHNAKIYNLS